MTGNQPGAGSATSIRRRDLLLGVGAPALGIEQHALDDVGGNIVRLEVFDGGHGIPRFLDRDRMVDDVAAADVAPFVSRFVERAVAGQTIAG